MAIAVLEAAPHGAASHRSALRLHRVDGFQRSIREIVVPASCNNVLRSGALVHRTNVLAPVDLTVVDGITSVTVERALLQLGAVLSARRVKVALGAAVRDGKTTIPRLRRRFVSLAVRGRDGIAAMRLALETWDDSVPPLSELESRVLAVLEGHSIPTPEREVRAPWRPRALERVDFVWWRERVILECDSRRWHAMLDAMANDRRRDRLAAAAGFLVLRCTHDDVVVDPSGLASVVARTLARRRRELGVA